MSQVVTLVVAVIAIVVAAAVAYLLRDRWWPLLSHWKQEATLLLPQYQKPLRAIVDKLNAGHYPTMHDRISAIRNWVNTNSVHLIDDEHDSYAFHVPTAIKKLNEFNDGAGSRPHLSCGPRAYAMKEILDAMGIESRIIDLFVIRENGSPDSHTLIEVFNNETDRWELQDPDFNVVYVSSISRAILSSQCAISAPSYIHYKSNGFDIENLENLVNTVEQFFQLGVLYRNSYDGCRSWFLRGQGWNGISADAFDCAAFGELLVFLRRMGCNPKFLLDDAFSQGGRI